MRYIRVPVVVLLLLVALAVACGRKAEEEAVATRVLPRLRPTFTPTSLPTDTPAPPTDTPIPPTNTPLPTDTPSPTDTAVPTDTPIPPTDTPLPPTASTQPTQKPRAPTPTPRPPTATPVRVLLEDRFDGGPGPGWRAFLNYWRLSENQWYWSADGGVGGSGALAHDCCSGGGEAEDALMMYLGDGAEGWTDYRVQVQFMAPTDKKGQWQGLWVRGQYEERTRKEAAQWVTGYYVMVGRQRAVKLLQLQTAEDCQDKTCRHPENQYAFNNPYILHEETVEAIDLGRGVWHTLAVEVRGSRIAIWVDGVFAFEYVDDKSPFLQGTVGFKTLEAQPVLYDNMVVTPLN